MAAGTTLENGPLTALVKGRVPDAYIEAIDQDVAERRKTFPRASRADVMRDAFILYFKNHPLRRNGHARKHRDNGR